MSQNTILITGTSSCIGKATVWNIIATIDEAFFQGMKQQFGF